jgi:hypothetical protein
MNAAQSKALLAAARNALALLDPDWPVAHTLSEAIAKATETPLAGQKCVFCEQPIKGESFPGFCKKLKPRVACRQCTHSYIVNRDSFARWCDRSQSIAYPLTVQTRKERQTAKERLSYCACGGKAEDHREDRDGNLLECSHCDNCDHFHYQTENQEAA